MSTNVEVLSAVHGIAPRSPELLQLGIDFEKGRASQESFDQQLLLETENWLGLQVDAGIDHFENGKLRWQDHLRPIVKACHGFAPDVDNAPVTRWFESNRFYRQPTIEGDIRLDEAHFQEITGPPGVSVSLLGPHTFSLLAASKLDQQKTTEVIKDLYAQLYNYYAARGVERLLLEEYFAGYLPAYDAQSNEHLFPRDDRLDIVKIPGHLFQSNKTREQWRYGQRYGDAWQSSTIVRAVDAGTTAPDTQPEVLFDTGGRYVLTHTVDFECLPLLYAQDKVKRLGEFAANIKEELL